MITPVGEDALLDFFIQALLHAVHILELVGLNALVVGALTASYGVFEA